MIETLEEGRVSSLPEGIYRRAIVRAVAAEVGLNPEAMLRDFTSWRPDDLQAPETTVVVAAEPGRHLIQSALAFVGAILPLLAGAAYFAWPSAGANDIAPQTPPRATRGADAWRPEIMPAGGFTDAPPALPRPVVVTLTFSSKCQLRIVADGREVLGRTVEQGESVPIELGDELLLLGDNAAAVQFSINGQAGRMLGEPGAVLSVRIGRDDYEDFLARY